MTVRVYPAPWRHPLECEVCNEGTRQVGLSRLFSFEGQRVASRMSLVIPCPQCTSAEPLVALLPRDTGGQT